MILLDFVSINNRFPDVAVVTKGIRLKILKKSSIILSQLLNLIMMITKIGDIKLGLLETINKLYDLSWKFVDQHIKPDANYPRKIIDLILDMINHKLCLHNNSPK